MIWNNHLQKIDLEQPFAKNDLEQQFAKNDLDQQLTKEWSGTTIS